MPSAAPVVQPVAVTAQEAQPLTNVPLATFTAPGAAPGDVMAAFINWGDGSSGAGTVTQNGGTFTVTGSHTYLLSEVTNITVIVGDLNQGTQASVGEQVTIHHGALPDGTAGNADERWVENALVAVLLRPVSQADVTYWYNRFEGEFKQDRFILVQEVAEQTPPFEYYQDTVQRYYNHLLHRNADPAGLAYWTNQFYSNVYGFDIKSSIAASDEFFQTQAGGTDAGYVTALYEDILKRAPDAAGQAYFEQQLAGGVSRFDVALEFSHSVEQRTHRVETVYEQILGRPADPVGLAQWVSDITNPTPSVSTGITGVIELIVSGDEFYDNAQI